MKEGTLVRIKATGELAEVIEAKGTSLKVARILEDELDSVAIDLNVTAIEVPRHYTIREGGEGTYVVGHSLGAGWVRHIVELKDGDTADNPASTKGPVYGPGVIVYDVSPSNVTATQYEDTREFYEALARARETFDVHPSHGLMMEA